MTFRPYLGINPSYAKNTAINTKFDFDLVSPFKRNAFDSNGTLKQMYNDVYDFLYEKYKNEAEIKQQKVSIGLEFYADSDRDVIKIDVVPGRELNQDQYSTSICMYIINVVILMKEAKESK